MSGCKFLSEHQLSTQVINPFWDRFRFYCSGWESSQTSAALRNGSAGPWQLSACLGEGQRRMHIVGTSTSPLSSQQIFTIVAEKIPTCIKLYEREMYYSKETEKTVATGGYCNLLSIVRLLLGK